MVFWGLLLLCFGVIWFDLIKWPCSLNGWKYGNFPLRQPITSGRWELCCNFDWFDQVVLQLKWFNMRKYSLSQPITRGWWELLPYPTKVTGFRFSLHYPAKRTDEVFLLLLFHEQWWYKGTTLLEPSALRNYFLYSVATSSSSARALKSVDRAIF